MRVLICSINFTPELTGTGKYTGEMAAWLAACGHELRVVSAPPYYPDWCVASGYSGSRYRKQLWCFDNGAQAQVWRTPIWVPRYPNGLKRLFHLASFALSSLPAMLAQIIWRPDLVVIVEPTLACAPMALLTARLSRSKAWLHIQDFEVDAAFEMGLLRSRLVRRVALSFEKALMRRFDRVSTISERMLSRLDGKGVAIDRQVLFPNWADVDEVRPLEGPSSFRGELGIPNNRAVALYAGNLGEKQGLELLIQAARDTVKESDLVWVLAGAGSARQRLEAMSNGLPNVIWLPLQPRERLNDLLNLADIHLLPQRADAADLVMPSKLTGMLASGRAVVATAAPDTQVAKVVKDCGVVVPPGDSAEFSKAVIALAKDTRRRAELGCRARQYAEDNLKYDAIMAHFEQECVALVNADPRSAQEKA